MEAATKREYKTIVVTARTIDPKTEKVESKVTRTIDSRERRDWIASVVMYAAMNGKIAEFINKEDDKDEG